MGFSEQLKNARIKMNYTQQQVADLMGIAKSTYCGYETGKRHPDVEKIKQLAQILRTSGDALLETGFDNVDEWLKKNTIPVPPMGRLPILSRVSAGHGTLAYDDIIGYEYADERYCNGEYFFLNVIGDSMTPDINDGDRVLVHKQDSVDSGSYSVVIVDDDSCCIKRVKYGKDWIELHSSNNYYPVREFKGTEVLRIRVIGKVVQIIRNL